MTEAFTRRSTGDRAIGRVAMAVGGQAFASAAAARFPPVAGARRPDDAGAATVRRRALPHPGGR